MPVGPRIKERSIKEVV